MKSTTEMVDSYAEKLLIRLSDEENKMVLDEFDTIDRDIDIINSIEGIENVEPQCYALLDQTCNSLREDKGEETPDIKDLLANADKKIGREIIVPKVVGE